MRKITLINNIYELKRLKNGKHYITRRLTKRAFDKMMKSKDDYRIKAGIL